jgi:hypothetical protein
VRSCRSFGWQANLLAKVGRRSLALDFRQAKVDVPSL